MKKLFYILPLAATLLCGFSFRDLQRVSAPVVSSTPSIVVPIETNCMVWLDATNLSGTNGTLIGTWTSQASPNFQLKQPTDNPKPILTNNAGVFGGKNFLLFSGTNFLTNTIVSGNQPLYVFALLNLNDSGFRFIYDSITASTNLRAFVSTTLRMSSGTSFDPSISVANLTNKWVLYEFYHNGANSQIVTNGAMMGAAVGNSGNNNLYGLTLGASSVQGNGGYFKLSTFLIYTNISAESRTNIRNYFRTNYSLW